VTRADAGEQAPDIGAPPPPDGVVQGTRQFPCVQCGAKVEFAPGTDSLRCPYCGHETQVPASAEVIEEIDFMAALAGLEQNATMEDVPSVTCTSCAAHIEPPKATEAFPCPYCGSSIVVKIRSEHLVKPQALLPFKVPRNEATELFRRWLKTRWFAPNALKKFARLEGRLQGLYTPYWTYDAVTVSRYTGQRGDNYTVRVGKRTQTRIRWRPASGTVARDFDDVLVVGSRSLPRELAEKLEPWDVASLEPHADEYLSGFLAERYQIDLREAWKRAIERMDEVIRGDVKRQIGGDHQRIDSLQTRHSGVTYKHVLLPLWICSYRFKDRVFRFLVNARTGEVQGQRPWSWVKIGLAALLVAAIVLFIAYLDNR
jgi:DNA-directed RNA polymerase subunit RPC12/RpoP